ncbi:PLP-dependent aminotransferase family protein [Bacillus cytotoxicus]|uniref:Transcriptional regulator, GntR family n=1 Tax=Bacillus cytotoxicus TaxID=580165 RepID=A0AAX2CIE0_9BACI|nr:MULTISPECIES: PLP-dependent aminotransferase family protein [Bacillus cereus group]AWC33244.1 PLP-dependent aminotransferase family protein [Bacillus cytotoxicus]AWC37268.1 PLP-dependent aminotransferase family protein [Bacillus cytotoxicus]AWC61535.1 PLP-dependent aminotransferase family protein [Bacillus cytotoxicus]KMT49787.1 GntR family transcriptional regulator [Bacillus cytotoxicus]MDH2889636.1 PLP-dependent aminotransferase family protein [Bacillus cytotoxicus]
MKNTIFAFKGDSPKYIQIYEQFKVFIERGDISAGEQLPSIRQLAESLQVSRNTTLMAYDQLVAEGYIRGEGRKGYFANEIEPFLSQETLIHYDKKKQESLLSSFIDFKAGAVDQVNFPLKIWRRISNKVLTLQETFQYGEPFGETCLREQISTYLFQSRGVKTEPNAIIIGGSTQQMLIYLGQILKDDFQSVIVEDPGYDGAREAFKLNRFALETLPVYETGADFSQLEHMKSRLIYVAPSHHSPYGVSMPIQQRHSLIYWAKKKQGYIIEDDYDSEFRYTQQPFPALASIDSTRVIYLGNFSKAFLPGIRMSYMVLPQPILNRYKNQFLHFESTTSILSQFTMAKFMEEGEWNSHIKRMRIVYKKKMHHLVSVLKEHFNENVSIIGEQSGLYLLIKVHLNRSEEWLIQQAHLYGVKVYPTTLYFIKNTSKKPIIKLGFGNLSYDKIQIGVELLKKAWL